MSERAGTQSGAFWGDVDDQAALERYQTLVSTVDDGIYQLDAAGNFVGVNDKIVETTGYSRDELLGEHVSLVLDDAETERIKRDFRERLEVGDDVDGVTYETLVETADGAYLTCELQISLLVSDGQFRGSIGIVRDVTDRKRYERHLEIELEEVVERITDGFLALDTDWNITHINERGQEIVDAEDHELLGKNFWETYPEVVDTRFEEAYRRAMATQEPTTIEEYYPPFDIWFEEHLYPSETGLSVYFRDVTERKERERELKRNKEQLETTFEVLPVGIVVAEANGEIVEANDTAHRIWGGDVFDADSIEEYEQYPVRWADSGERVDPGEMTLARVVNGEEVTDPDVFEIDAADGERRIIEVEGIPIRDEAGEVDRGVVTMSDVTEQIERETNLEQYETIVEAVNDGVYVVDDEGYVTMVNEAYAEMLGYTPDRLVGMHGSEVVDEDVIDRVEELQTATVEGEIDRPTMDAEVQTVGDDVIPVEATFAALPEDDSVGHRVGIVRDISERKERERQLEESERRYRTLIENFPNGSVGLYDEDFTYTVVGGKLLDELGYSPDDVVGTTIYGRYPDDLIDRIKPHFSAVFDGESNAFEIDLGERYLSAHTLPVRNADDEIYAGMLVVQDITERKEHERALEESEARFRMLAESLDEMVWISDPDTRELRYLNPAYEEIWGRDRQSLEDDPAAFLEAVHPDDRQRIRRAYEAVPDEAFDEEYRIVRPDGEVRWLDVRAGPVRHDESKRVIGIAEDITERKERERALEESERRYRTLVEDFPNGAVGLYDEDLCYTAVGGQLLRAEGIDPEERIGRSIRELYPDELVDEVEPYFHAALEGEANTFEIEYLDRNLFNRTLPVRNADDEVYAGMLVVQDVTERREYERRLEESNERLEQFAYAASHDLQEPLRMVSSYLGLIERRYGDELDEDGEEFLEYAVDGAERMREMIDGLLQYSRVETRGDSFEPVDLDAVLADARQDLQVKIEEHDAEITTESLPVVEGDDNQLRQVFQNLLDNAIEYSGDAPPRIEISTERRPGDEWVISVRDEGIGVDPDDADRVFEVFQSLHAQDEYGGTGIGLALCERIVERHGGEIWVESELGEGATFSFTLSAVSDGDG